MAPSPIAQVQRSHNELLNWLLTQRSRVLTSQPPHVLDLFRRLLTTSAALYPPLSATTQLVIPAFVIPSDAKHEPVRQLRSALAPYQQDLVATLVFSSVATRDYIEHWSDLDILVVVANSVLHDTNRFRQLRQTLLEAEQYLSAFDPWQHHGIQYVQEADLTFYPEMFLPLSTIARSASLFEPVTLKIATRDCYTEQVEHFYGLQQLMAEAAQSGQLRHHARHGVYLHDNFRNCDDAFYQLKYFVSVVLLLPSLYLALVDRPVYKRESFAKIRELFSASELELITACEQVRQLFRTVKPVGNVIPAEVLPVLGKNYFARAERLMRTFITAYEDHRSRTTP